MRRIYLNVTVELEDAEAEYLDSCCRIRKITRSRLMGRLLRWAAKDMLIESIFDDNGQQRDLMPGEKRRRFAGPNAP